MALTKRVAKEQPFEIRNSPVHGMGAFATRRIKKGTRIAEYLGERITHAEADRRYEDCDVNDNHTFLFVVDKRTVIDAGVDGSDARFIKHACDPNCESEIEDRRVFIDAIRDIEAGDELNYDYQIGREMGDPPNVDEIYACRCGSPKCRGTMLWPPKRPKKRGKKRTHARRPAAGAKSRSPRRSGRAGGGSAAQRKSQRGAAAGSRRAGAARNRRGSAASARGRTQQRAAKRRR
jgi:hypothetical protein